MDNVNQTLYIPLYGKAYVSRKGIILSDPMAEKLWDAEGFPLTGKSKSKWLAYYMGMRAAVYDRWLQRQPDGAVVLHLGCGLDSRVLRTERACQWYDIDVPSVVEERRRYYRETESYRMIGADLRELCWLDAIPGDRPAIVVMEGVSMYFQNWELLHILRGLRNHFGQLHLLMDCYTTFAAKASRYQNPIRDVGVTRVYGMDEPRALAERTGLEFVREYSMTPAWLIDQLPGLEQKLFRAVFAGGFSRKLYRLYEFRSEMSPHRRPNAPSF